MAIICEELPLFSLDIAASKHYGRIRAQLERDGTPIGANDLWIAAQALALGAVAVTDNVGEFSRVSGLTVENWLK
ncbi:MAG: PIN domain-containing protein [Sulfurimicrobium sp.]